MYMCDKFFIVVTQMENGLIWFNIKNNKQKRVNKTFAVATIIANSFSELSIFIISVNCEQLHKSSENYKEFK